MEMEKVTRLDIVPFRYNLLIPRVINFTLKHLFIKHELVIKNIKVK